MLPAAWVDRLFARLIAVYGMAFMRQYEGLQADDVKAMWAQELANFKTWPDAITYALDMLPERAPNVIEFRNICRRAPRPEQPRIEAPPADPAVVEAGLAQLDEIKKQMPSSEGIEWAHRIMRRYQMGERPSATSVKFAQQALRSRGLS